MINAATCFDPIGSSSGLHYEPTIQNVRSFLNSLFIVKTWWWPNRVETCSHFNHNKTSCVWRNLLLLSVHTDFGYGLDDRGIVRFPSEVQDISLTQNVRTDSEVHPNSYYKWAQKAFFSSASRKTHSPPVSECNHNSAFPMCLQGLHRDCSAFFTVYLQNIPIRLRCSWR
jgi:hypothetical protein